MAPDGLRYVNSWVSTDFSCCYQLMETADPALFESWIASWKDLAQIDVRGSPTLALSGGGRPFVAPVPMT